MDSAPSTIFLPIRVFGTIGFICAKLFVNFVAIRRHCHSAQLHPIYRIRACSV